MGLCMYVISCLSMFHNLYLCSDSHPVLKLTTIVLSIRITNQKMKNDVGCGLFSVFSQNAVSGAFRHAPFAPGKFMRCASSSASSHARFLRIMTEFRLFSGITHATIESSFFAVCGAPRPVIREFLTPRACATRFPRPGKHHRT